MLENLLLKFPCHGIFNNAVIHVFVCELILRLSLTKPL